MSEEFNGSCLCGSVTYQLSAAPQMTGTCFCVDCRKSSGTSHCTHCIVPEEALQLQGNLKFFDKPADSGNIVSRGFCPDCGSAVYSRNSGMPGLVFIRASSLEDMNLVSPSLTVYASRAPEWAAIDTSHPVFQEMMAGGPDAAMSS